MMKKILILDTTGSDWTDQQIANHSNVDVDRIYTHHCLMLRALRRYHLRSVLGLKSIWYGSWFNKMSNYDAIIIFSDIKDVSIFKDIRAVGYSGKLCFYYRDPVSRKRYHPNDIRQLDADVLLASFDSIDAQKYNMFYNPQFFFDELETKKTSLTYDVVSISSDRGRLPLIMAAKKMLDEKELKSYFYILKDKRKKYSNNDISCFLYDKSLAYEDILALNQASRSILEINAKGQVGLTNRAMEALFLEKKLITNNVSVSNLDFYHPDNIYIIGKDHRNLVEFLNTPYNSITRKSKKYYNFDSWLNRMKLALEVSK